MLADKRKAFDEVNGIPVHYDREPVAPYGSRGVKRTFYGDAKLITALEELVAEIATKSPASFGSLEVITSAGAYVDKSGAHGKGLAFDLDGVHWQNTSMITNKQPEQKMRYLAIQSLCHRHFGVVLGYNYNTAHEDHLHIDLSRTIRFRETKSVTYFMQEAVTAVLGDSIAIDGEWGNETEGAVKRACAELGIGPLRELNNWLSFLNLIADEAFRLAEQRLMIPSDNLIG